MRHFRLAVMLCFLLGILAGCASYQGAQATPAQYDKDGKAVPGDYRVESIFKF